MQPLVIVADRTGRVLAASSAAPPDFHPDRDTPASIRQAIASLIEDAADEAPRSAREILVHEDASAVVYPVFHGTSRIGG